MVLLSVATTVIALQPLNAQVRAIQRLDQNSTSQIQGQMQKAAALERIGQLEEAAQIYGQLYNQNSENRLLYDRYRDVLIRMSEYTRAESLIQQHLNQNPRDVESLVTLGTVYYNQNQRDKALRQWHSVIQAFGQNIRTYQAVLYAMLQNGLINEASDLVQEARTELKQPAFYALQLGSFFAARMSYGRATEEYLLYYQTHHANVSFFVSQISRFPDEPEVQKQVIPVLQNAIEQTPKDGQLIQVLADYEYRIQQYDNALRYYRRLESLEHQPGKYRLQVARDFLNDGEYSRSKQLYRELRQDPDVTKYQQAIYYGYAEAGYHQLVDQYQLHSDVDLFSNNIIWNFQFVILPENAGPTLTDIVAGYDSVLTRYPGTTEAQMSLYRLGQIYFRLGNDFDRALNYFQQCVDSPGHPNRIQAEFYIGFCHLAKADIKAARDQWTQIARTLKQGPPELEARANLYLAGTYLYDAQLDSAITRLGQIQSQLPVKSEIFNDILEVQTLIDQGLADKQPADSTTLRQFFRGEFYIKQHKITEAQREFLRISDEHRDTPIAPYALFRAAQLARELGQAQNVADWLEDILNAYGNSPIADQATFLLAEHFQQDQQDLQQAMHYYEQVLANFPGSLLEQRARTILRELQQKTS